MRTCRVIGYTTDEDGRDRVQVAFVDRTDLFEDAEACLSPPVLFPYLHDTGSRIA